MYKILSLAFIVIIIVIFLRNIPVFNYDKNLDIDDNIDQFITKDDIPDLCYDKLIKRGAQYYLFNSKEPLEMDTNPLVFNSLDSYANYERKKSLDTNYDCPILNYTGGNDNYTHSGEKMVSNKPTSQKPITLDNKDEEFDEYGTPILKPYTTYQIDSLDDYEYNRLYNDTDIDISKKDKKLRKLHLDPLGNHKQISYDLEKQMIDPGTIEPTKTKMSDEDLLLESQQKYPTKYNPLVEDDPKIIKKMYLEKHPELLDVKIKRTGYNSYKVIEITPNRDETDMDSVYQNRPDENKLIPEDLISYGNTPADPNASGLKYLSPLSTSNDYNDAVERMFAPSIPRSIWYQKGD